jgi:hypothetical protein
MAAKDWDDMPKPRPLWREGVRMMRGSQFMQPAVLADFLTKCPAMKLLVFASAATIWCQSHA